jgi:hypothetical protein
MTASIVGLQCPETSVHEGEKVHEGEEVKLIGQQKCSDSVLHESRILSRHFVTAQCPDKKAGAAGLPNSSQAILLQTLSQTRAEGLKENENSIFYVMINKARGVAMPHRLSI